MSNREKTAEMRESRAFVVRASPNAARILVSYGKGLAIAVAAAVFMAVISAFGTGDIPFFLRLVYWLVTMAVSEGIGLFVFEWLGPRLSGIANWWLRVAFLIVAMALPITAVVIATTRYAFADAKIGLEDSLWLFGAVAAVATAMTAINLLANFEPTKTNAANSAAERPRFLDRLPSKLNGAEILAIQSEDHYLRLHTSRGSDLILMRLSDAIPELEGLEGARTHRSWWIARAAVAESKRARGRTLLVLTNGLKVPVSRSYIRALRDDGWL